MGILFHELGHYYMASKLDIEVEVIEIGMGPVLLEWGLFAFKLFPFAGLMKPKEVKWAFKDPSKGILVFLAGPALGAIPWVILSAITSNPILLLIATIEILGNLLNLFPWPGSDGFGFIVSIICFFIPKKTRDLALKRIKQND